MEEKDRAWGIAKHRRYIIGLYRIRSSIALLASTIAIVFSLTGIVFGLLIYTRNGVPPIELFRYFTIDMNLFGAVGAGMIVPYAVEGIRKKRFSCPRWTAKLYYVGTSCIVLIMFFTVGLISWNDPELAFGGNNFFLHVICPLMVLLSFMLIESEYHYSLVDNLLCLIPVVVYGGKYIWEVVIVGAENGGWEDMYYFTVFMPAWLSALLMAAVSFGIAALIGHISNTLSAYRRRRLEQGLWDSDVDPVEIKIEIFGLGRYMGKHEESCNVTIPLDIIELIARRYDMKEEELIRIYTKGVLDSIKEVNGDGSNVTGGWNKKSR